MQFLDKPIMKAAISVCAGLCLAISFLAAGFYACCLPFSTEFLSIQTSRSDISPFSQEQLVKAAVATADYSFLTHDLDAELTMLVDINKEAATPYADLGTQAIATAPEQYTLDESALSHLDDCFAVAKAVRLPLALIALLAVAATAHVGVRMGRKPLASVLIAAGASMLAIFAVIGIWAAIDFWGFFSFFHTLFFTEGSWLFSYDSLLICMYPTGFWVGMAALWLATTIVLSILSLISGIVLKRKNHD